jgi:hypothetical protein
LNQAGINYIAMPTSFFLFPIFAYYLLKNINNLYIYTKTFATFFIGFVLVSSLIIHFFYFKILDFRLIKNFVMINILIFFFLYFKFFLKNISEISIDSVLNWATDHIGFVKVDHNARSAGSSNYNFKKLVSFALNTIISYSVKPLKITTYFGILIFGIGAALLVFILGKYLLFGIDVPGFTTTASLIILFSGTQLIILGVIGEYLARMHLNIMNKPAFVVRRTIGID